MIVMMMKTLKGVLFWRINRKYLKTVLIYLHYQKIVTG
ncbi:hypothetical protein M495_08595 [Serratia liquefaciens ATCC 27592]|nr:hypothetical protein M495_08595 [Serratia liquefaciens ATCC 27592]